MISGDLGVAKRVKALAKGFYGRIAAYDEGLEGADGALGTALERNVYAGTAPDGAAASLAAYVTQSVAHLAAVSLDDIAQGRLAFGPIVATASPDKTEEGRAASP